MHDSESVTSQFASRRSFPRYCILSRGMLIFSIPCLLSSLIIRSTSEMLSPRVGGGRIMWHFRRSGSRDPISGSSDFVRTFIRSVTLDGGMNTSRDEFTTVRQANRNSILSKLPFIKDSRMSSGMDFSAYTLHFLHSPLPPHTAFMGIPPSTIASRRFFPSGTCIDILYGYKVTRGISICKMHYA